MVQLTPDEINMKLVIPDWDKVSPIKEEEARFIYDFVKKHQLKRTLETGFAFARSASHIIAASESMHISIDPFQFRYKNYGINNIEKLGLKDYLDLRADYSHNILPQLLQEKRSFDFIFIDGDHKFDGILVDFYYAAMLLEKGGYVLLHDTWMRSTRLVMSFIKKNRKDFQKIHTPLRNFSLYQKIGDDKRDGMFFKEFYNFKMLFVHYLINWMNSGKKGPVKKLAIWMKEKVK
ncbi:MAG: class I SAM-dependent methyltransferase [Bacteroidales bacterium]